MAERSPDDILASVVESSRNIKFGRGVVSKTSYVAALIAVIWGGIVWRMGDNLAVNVGLMLAGLVPTGFAFWYIRGSQQFAERNPAQALLEGAELLEWHRLEAAAKGLPSPPDQPLLDIKPAKPVGEVDG